MSAHANPETDEINTASRLRILTYLVLSVVICLAIIAGSVLFVQFWMTLSDDTQTWLPIGTVGLACFIVEMAVLIKIDLQKGR